MHVFSSVSSLLINAEVDSMGGVIDGGVGIGTKTSPRRAAIEKAQAELRLEYDVREERRRELEFLVEGGNPLDFRFGHAASVSVQSTSFTDQHAEQYLISEAKGSFALTASPYGDSVESSGRLGINVASEPNSADNFDGESQLLECARKSKHPRSNISPSEHSSQLYGSQNGQVLEDSPIFHLKRGQAYRRRYRSRTNRDVARSCSTDVASRGGHNSLLSGHHGMVAKTVNSDDQLNIGLVGTHANDSPSLSKISILDGRPDSSANNDMLDHGNIKVHGYSLGMASKDPDSARGSDLAVPECTICPPADAEKVENHDTPRQLNESSNLKGEEKCTQTDGLMSSVGFTPKGLDSESSCTQTSLSVDGNGNIYSKLCNLKPVDGNGASEGEKLAEMPNIEEDQITGKKDVTDAVESGMCTNNHNSVVENHQGNGFTDVDRKKMHRSEANCSSYIEETESTHHAEVKSHMKENAAEDTDHNLQYSPPQKLQVTRDNCNIDPTDTVVLDPRPSAELPTYGESQLKVVDKAHEDKILAEAQIIEAKRKRIAEVSIHALPTEYHKKSHWDFVVEEMAWLANDFAQERLWKITAAAQICHRVAFASQLRSKEKDKHGRLRIIARKLANAVMEFWQLAELLLQDDGMTSGPESSKYDAVASRKIDKIGVLKEKIAGPGEELDKDSEERLKNHTKNLVLPVQGYAVRFLQYNCFVTSIVGAGAFETADLASDLSMPDIPWKDHEENLFHIVPPGSTETYRKSIQSYLVCSEKGNNRQDDDESSVYDAAAEFGSQENEYEEDEGESVYYLPGAFERRRSLKIVHKKRKKLKSYAARSYELGGDFSYGNCIENRAGAHQSGLPGKISMNSLSVGTIPTKRMRTASRQRVVGPVSMGAAGGVPTPTRNNASSGDTNSFQDDQSMLHGGSMIQKGSEVESGMAVDKKSVFDPTEFPSKPRKKKKAKHQAITYDQRWVVDSIQNEQRDHLRKRVDNHQLESNGSTGLFVHHAKKQKLMKQSCDNSYGNRIPMSGSITSAASQMSNMSNPNKLPKFIGGRDQARKVKLAKVPIRQPGSGNEWTLYEDQALVVLVHDMGPNWELVSDAFNSTLLFKCLFRRPIECKERHKALMDGPSGDGADSADDSGSSQPYQSTLPGIPKGCARQLFRQLQGPLEEDTIKSNFEKITLIGQRLTHQKKQNNNQDPKQIAPVHGSHIATLSQVIPNNVNGGGVLTPLDLCDVSGSSPDAFPLGCQPTAGLASPNQGVIPSMLPPGGNGSLQHTPGMGINSNLVSAVHPNGSIRDWRYGVSRTTSGPIDEPQRVQQYNHMLPNRSIQQPNLSVSGPFSGADRNMCMLPGGGMGMMPGINRSVSMPRPGFQGIAASSMLNSGTMLGMPSTTNMHSGGGPGQGNSIVRPGETMHLPPRPNQSVEHRQQMLPEMQMQVTQANSQGVPPFSGLSSPFQNQSASLPVQNFPVHNKQQHQVPQNSNVMTNPHHPHLQGPTHPSSAEQQAFLRGARHQQQRILHRQQQQQAQFPVSSALMAHGQTQSHLPISSPLQNNFQIQSPTSSQTVSLATLAPSSPLTPSQQQHQHQLPPPGLGRSSQSGMSGGMNQTGKQLQKQSTQQHQQQHQQFHQSGRHHPHQHQRSQSVHQAKQLKGIGRGNMVMQNLPLDPSHLNGLSTNQVNQTIERGEQPMHLMQGHGVYSGLKSLVPPQSSSQTQPQQKPSSRSTPLSTQKVQQMPFHSDDSNRSQAAAVPSAVRVPASTQALPPSVMPSNSQQLRGQHLPQVKLVNRSQTVIQRSTEQSCQPSADPLAKSQYEQAQQEQEFVNNVCALGMTSGTPTTGVESSNPVSVASSTSIPSAMSSSPQIGPIGSPHIPVSSGDEPLPVEFQGMGQRQLSENPPSHNSVGTQWQQQQSNLQLPPPLPPLLLQKQSQQQPLEQLPKT
ncbi:hypothetical protein Dimus_032590 [Dionaea muscipula]